MLNDIAYWCAATYTARQPQTGQKEPTMNDDDLIKELREPLKAPAFNIHKFEKRYNQQRSKAANRIEELEVKQDWQPIETAPKDGTMVFVWHPINVRQRHASFESSIRKAKFLPELDEWQVESVGGYPPPVVTHWRPLFDPPKGANDE